MELELELECIKIISSICIKGTRNTIPISKPVTSWTQVRCVNLLHSFYDLSVGTLQKFLSTLKPSRNWGPVDTMDRHWWVQWRVTCNKTGQRDFTFKRRGTKDYTSSIQKYHTTDPAGIYRTTPSSANGTLQHNRGTNRGPFTIQTNGALPEHVCWRGTLQQGGDGTWQTRVVWQYQGSQARLVTHPKGRPDKVCELYWQGWQISLLSHLKR